MDNLIKTEKYPYFIAFTSDVYAKMKSIVSSFNADNMNFEMPDGTSANVYCQNCIDKIHKDDNIENYAKLYHSINQKNNTWFIMDKSEIQHKTELFSRKDSLSVRCIDFLNDTDEKIFQHLRELFILGTIESDRANIPSNLDELPDVLNYFENPVKKIPTGINSFDNIILNGGYSYGLHIIQGMTGTGKTSLLLQMADNIAKRGIDVLYFSLEMSKEELIAKSLSRIGFDIIANWKKTFDDNALYKHTNNADDILQNRMNQNKKDTLNKSIESYKKFANHLFYICSIGVITIDTIKSILNNFLDGHKQSVIILDYLQLISPTDTKMNEYEKLNTIIMVLKEFANEYKIPIICISSMNRDSYEKESKLGSSSGSSRIEYTATTLIEIRNSKQQLDNKDLKLIEIHNQKNRFGNNTDSEVKFFGKYGKYFDDDEKQSIINGCFETSDELIF